MNDGAIKVQANAECPQPFVCPLSSVRAGTSVRIKQLSAPPEVTHRLREMGFCEEQKVRLLAQQANIICQVCNVRLGISTQLAEKILVEPIHAHGHGHHHAHSHAKQAA
jgi:Fe2+ transport system protein FeoA